MESSKRLFRYLGYHQLGGVAVFWLVMLLVNTLSALMAFTLTSNVTMGPHIVSGQLLSFAGANVLAIFIFFIVYGLEMYYECFSLAAGFGNTRRNFYLNVILNNIIMVSIFSLVQYILLRLDNYIVSMIGFEPMEEFGLFNINDSIISILFTLGFTLLVFASFMNLIGVLQYRFGYKFWIALGIFGLLAQMFTNFIGILIHSFRIVIEIIMDGYLLIGLPIILISYLIGYMVIRRANVK